MDREVINWDKMYIAALAGLLVLDNITDINTGRGSVLSWILIVLWLYTAVRYLILGAQGK